MIYSLQPQGKTPTSPQHLQSHLYALVDMAALNPEQKKSIQSKFAHRLYPLMPAHPELEELMPLGAHLITSSNETLESQDQLIFDLRTHNSDVISAWITSPLPAQQLVEHFEQATYAKAENGTRYLLRYYDPVITTILYGEASQEWQQWLFGPIKSWWLSMPDTQGEQWVQLKGHQQKNPGVGPQLTLTDELWQALTQDPLPYRILQYLEEKTTTRFTSHCHGVRLAQVKALLQDARGQGFSGHNDLCDFVYLCLNYSKQRILSHANWEHVRRRILSNNEEAMLAMVQRHILAS